LEISLAFFEFDLAADKKVRAPPKFKILAGCENVRLWQCCKERLDGMSLRAADRERQGPLYAKWIAEGETLFVQLEDRQDGNGACDANQRAGGSKVGSRQFRNVRMTKAGTFLISHMNLGKVIEYDKEWYAEERSGVGVE
jgi:hypothetical protein